MGKIKKFEESLGESLGESLWKTDNLKKSFIRAFATRAKNGQNDLPKPKKWPSYAQNSENFWFSSYQDKKNCVPHF